MPTFSHTPGGNAYPVNASIYDQSEYWRLVALNRDVIDQQTKDEATSAAVDAVSDAITDGGVSRVRGQIPAEITALSQMNHADYNGLWQANLQMGLSDAPFEMTQATLVEILIGSPANAAKQVVTSIHESWWREANVGGSGTVSSWGQWRKYADLDDVAGAGADALRSRPNLPDGTNIDNVRGVADAGAHRMPVTFTYGGTWPAGDRSDQQETLLVLPSGNDGQTCTQMILRYDQTWIRHAPGAVWGAWRALSSRPVVLSPSDNLDTLGEGTYMTNLETTSAALGLPGGRNGVLTRSMPAASQYLDVFMTNLTEARPDFQVWVRGMNSLGAWTDWQRIFPAVPPVTHAVVASNAASNWTASLRYFDKNADTLDRPASTLKVLTLYVARKTITAASGMINDLVTVTEADVAANPGGSGGITFQAGDQISYRDLFHAMMLPSSNWAAEIIARAVGDQLTGTGTSREKFLTAMRDTADEFGWTGYHITNPTGLGNGNQLSAAMLVQLMFAAGGDALLRGIMGTQERTITFTGPNARTQVIRNTTDPNGDIAFPEMIAAKTGSLDSGAHTCLVMLWEKPDGTQAVSALMGSDTDNRFKDMRTIIDRTILASDDRNVTAGSFAIRGSLPDGADLDQMWGQSKAGSWRLQSVHSYLNLPFTLSQAAILEVMPTDNPNGARQVVSDASQSWWREAYSAGAWGEWHKYLSQEDLPLSTRHGVVSSLDLNSLRSPEQSGHYVVRKSALIGAPVDVDTTGLTDPYMHVHVDAVTSSVVSQRIYSVDRTWWRVALSASSWRPWHGVAGGAEGEGASGIDWDDDNVPYVSEGAGANPQPAWRRLVTESRSAELIPANTVGSADVRRIIVSDDPDTPLEDGDLLLVFGG